MNKELIQRERNRLAEQGTELTPDEVERMIAFNERLVAGELENLQDLGDWRVWLGDGVWEEF